MDQSMKKRHRFWGFVFLSIIFHKPQTPSVIISKSERNPKHRSIGFSDFIFDHYTICLRAVRHLLLLGFEVLLEREEHRRALQAANCSGHPERMDQADGTKRVDGATPI